MWSLRPASERSGYEITATMLKTKSAAAVRRAAACGSEAAGEDIRGSWENSAARLARDALRNTPSKPAVPSGERAYFVAAAALVLPPAFSQVPLATYFHSAASLSV